MVGFGVGRSRENILTSKYVQRQNEAKQTLYRAEEGFFPKKLSTTDCCQPSEQLAKAVSSKQVTQPLEETLREQ